MRGQAEVDAQRQRMNEDAYFLTIKTMVVKGDNPDMTLLTRLRMGLGIANDTARNMLTELLNHKRNNTLHECHPMSSPAIGGMPPGGNRIQSAPSSSAYVAGGAGAMHSKTDGNGSKKMKKMKHLASAGGGPSSLLPENIGRKVKRFWPAESAWFDGVITDHKSSTGDYCITYSLGMKNETFEWLNVSLLVAEGVLKLLSDHVDLLSYPKSRAVQSSSVLKNRRGADGGSKRKSAGDYSVGPTGRKRNITAMYDGDSDDMNDLL